MFVFVLLVALWGCDRRDAENPSAEGASSASSPDSESEPDGKGTTRSPRVDAPPSAAGAMAPNLYPRPDGVGLSWLEPAPRASRKPGAPDDPMQMRHAALTDGSWSKPQTVVANVEFFANWADVPSVARATNGTLYAHWPQKSAADTYAYDVVLARSEDDGGTWATLGAPHDDGTPTEHGFAKMIPGDSGVRLVWLDGRQMADDPPGPMTLRSAVAGEKFGEPALLDARVCDCCATDAVAIEDGAIVVYRDRGEDEVRDIAVQRLAGGEWHSTTPVHADGWTIPGCPVNGPAIAADGVSVAVAWFTGAGQRSRVRVAFSSDGGVSFGEPLDLDAQTGDDAPLGRVDVVHLAGDEFAVSWLDGAGDGATIRLQRVATSGKTGEPLDIAPAKRSRGSGVPRIEAFDGQVVAVWTVPEEPSKLLAKSIPFAAIPPANRRSGAVSADGSGPRRGWTLPLVYGRTLEGTRQRLKADGKTLVVNLWATWCEPCRRELPLLDELQRERTDVHVVAISVDAAQDEEAVRDWVKGHRPKLQVLLDPENRASRIFGVDALPATFVFGPDDRLTWFKRGAVEHDELIDAL